MTTADEAAELVDNMFNKYHELYTPSDSRNPLHLADLKDRGRHQQDNLSIDITT